MFKMNVQTFGNDFKFATIHNAKFEIYRTVLACLNSTLNLFAFKKFANEDVFSVLSIRMPVRLYEKLFLHWYLR